jgi:hypothetical protein
MSMDLPENMPPRANQGLALNLCLAYIAYTHGVTFATAKKDYEGEAAGHLGTVWYWLAYLAEEWSNGRISRLIKRVHQAGPVQ